MTHLVLVVSAPALVVLLTGPSGCGKSHLARRSGLPVVSLDRFYRNGDDPAVPRVDGLVDWDHPDAWDASLAVETLSRLAVERRAEIPVYDIAQDRRVGSDLVEIGSAPAFVAEGIFAAEIVRHCRDEGILADALCLRQHPAKTFYRRLRRDLAEARKPRTLLVRRGISLFREEAEVVWRQMSLGAYPCGHEEALYRIRLAAHARAVPAQPVAAVTAEAPNDLPTAEQPTAVVDLRPGRSVAAS